MFYVNHGLEGNVREIRRVLKQNQNLGFVMAFTFFEWSVCRAIAFAGVANGHSNDTVWSALDRVSNPENYRRTWKKLVGQDSLPAAVGDPTWSALTKRLNASSKKEMKRRLQEMGAFELRSKIVHGFDQYSVDQVAHHFEVVITATENVWKHARERGHDLGGRLPVRRKHKKSDSEQPRSPAVQR